MHLLAILATLSLLVFPRLVNAGVFFVQPLSGSTCTAGTPCVLSWDDDGILPLLPQVGTVTAGLFTGNQQLVQTIRPLEVANLNSVNFTPIAQAGPNSDSYYIAFTSTTAKVNGTAYTAYSPFFRLTGMSGSFSSPLASATATFSIPASFTNTGTIIPTTITVGNVDTSLPPSPSQSTTFTSSSPSLRRARHCDSLLQLHLPLPPPPRHRPLLQTAAL
ncbi:hypothetical protein K438DRAFT_140309 [Mycena galopus ATCC 62051]|nr:hypothetical protein K438DRAFT_140309 [Mycena galopus ATCC 62051]